MTTNTSYFAESFDREVRSWWTFDVRRSTFENDDTTFLSQPKNDTEFDVLTVRLMTVQNRVKGAVNVTQQMTLQMIIIGHAIPQFFLGYRWSSDAFFRLL